MRIIWLFPRSLLNSSFFPFHYWFTLFCSFFFLFESKMIAFCKFNLFYRILFLLLWITLLNDDACCWLVKKKNGGSVQWRTDGVDFVELTNGFHLTTDLRFFELLIGIKLVFFFLVFNPRQLFPILDFANVPPTFGLKKKILKIQLFFKYSWLCLASIRCSFFFWC